MSPGQCRGKVSGKKSLSWLEASLALSLSSHQVPWTASCRVLGHPRPHPGTAYMLLSCLARTQRVGAECKEGRSILEMVPLTLLLPSTQRTVPKPASVANRRSPLLDMVSSSRKDFWNCPY